MSEDAPFVNLLRVLRGGWTLIAISAAACALVAAAVGFLLPTTYEATTTVEVATLDDSSSPNMETQATIARSTGVLREAVKDLSRWKLSELKDSVSVNVPRGADVLQVSVSADDADRAAAAANAVAKAYLEDRANENGGRQQREVALLSTEIADLKKEVAETTVPADRTVLEARLASLNASYDDARETLGSPGRVLSEAEAPSSPSTPGLLVWVAGGLAAGALIGFYAATVRLRFGRRA